MTYKLVVDMGNGDYVVGGDANGDGMVWTVLPGGTFEMLGIIPMFLDSEDPRSAAQQFDANYAHGGGWRPFGKEKWRFRGKDGQLSYPGDPDLMPIAKTQLRGDTIYVYPYGYVCIDPEDGDFEVCRMD